MSTMKFTLSLRGEGGKERKRDTKGRREEDRGRNEGGRRGGRQRDYSTSREFVDDKGTQSAENVLSMRIKANSSTQMRMNEHRGI